MCNAGAASTALKFHLKLQRRILAPEITDE
jgi:hypothetical protein